MMTNPRLHWLDPGFLTSSNVSSEIRWASSSQAGPSCDHDTSDIFESHLHIISYFALSDLSKVSLLMIEENCYDQNKITAFVNSESRKPRRQRAAGELLADRRTPTRTPQLSPQVSMG